MLSVTKPRGYYRRPDQLISQSSDSTCTFWMFSGSRGGFCSDEIVCEQ
uniref:Uncharacterized protein n=1 Tax=Arundo donax TaxID=35708 RepID=A0A0A9Q4F5_ARUDO